MLPEDPIILMSYINTKLRDNYSSFDEFCLAEPADPEEVKRRLEEAGFIYDEAQNKFR